MKTQQERANTHILQAHAAKENGQLEDAIHHYREAMKLGGRTLCKAPHTMHAELARAWAYWRS